MAKYNNMYSMCSKNRAVFEHTSSSLAAIRLPKLMSMSSCSSHPQRRYSGGFHGYRELFHPEFSSLKGFRVHALIAFSNHEGVDSVGTIPAFYIERKVSSRPSRLSKNTPRYLLRLCHLKYFRVIFDM